MTEGGGSSFCCAGHFHGDLLEDEICFTEEASPVGKGLLPVSEVGILSRLKATSVPAFGGFVVCLAQMQVL